MVWLASVENAGSVEPGRRSWRGATSPGVAAQGKEGFARGAPPSLRGVRVRESYAGPTQS